MCSQSSHDWRKWEMLLYRAWHRNCSVSLSSHRDWLAVQDTSNGHNIKHGVLNNDFISKHSWNVNLVSILLHLHMIHQPLQKATFSPSFRLHFHMPSIFSDPISQNDVYKSFCVILFIKKQVCGDNYLLGNAAYCVSSSLLVLRRDRQCRVGQNRSCIYFSRLFFRVCFFYLNE